jgi:enoyl-CoA hydratase/carnithine racemase
MISPRSFKYAEDGGVATITLSRPEKLNALTFEVYRELEQTFLDLAHREAVKVVILTGEGKAFCSGGDVNAIIGELVRRDARGLLEFTQLTCNVIKAMRSLRKPVVAALNGTVAGAGAVLALASDLRIATGGAKIAFLFTKVGLAGADMGAAYLLPRVVGLSRATEWLMLGDFVDPREALAAGLYNRVVPAERLMAEAGELALRLAAGPTLALAVTKDLLNQELHMEMLAAIDAEARAQALLMQTHDFAEAYRAFVEKRPPRFEGR